MSKTRILFVDDEASILDVIRAMMEPFAADWEPVYANSGAEALAQMADAPFDVLVSDMRMPNLSGAELLAEVQKRHPRTIRIILSGYADSIQVMQAVATTHQFLSKPFKLDDLLATLTRIQALQAWVMNDRLRSLIGRMSHLPSLPDAYFRLCRELNSPHSNLEDIGALISNDPALTAKVLQLVNSAFFGFAQPVFVATEAVQLLGVNTIRAMALTTHIFSVFNALHLKDTPAADVWAHSMKVSELALQHARREAASRNVMEQAFTAGALHDIGKLILAANLPAEYRRVGQQVQQANIPLIEAERAVFGATHADVGGYLLGVWGLPVPLVEAVALHHQPPAQLRPPTDCGARPVTPLSAVKLANAQAHGLAPG